MKQVPADPAEVRAVRVAERRGEAPPATGSPLRPHSLLELQRTAGNRAVQRLLAAPRGRTLARFSDQLVRERADQVKDWIEAKVQVRAHEIFTATKITDEQANYFEAKKQVEEAWQHLTTLTSGGAITSAQWAVMKLGLSSEEYKTALALVDTAASGSDWQRTAGLLNSMTPEEACQKLASLTDAQIRDVCATGAGAAGVSLTDLNQPLAVAAKSLVSSGRLPVGALLPPAASLADRLIAGLVLSAPIDYNALIQDIQGASVAERRVALGSARVRQLARQELSKPTAVLLMSSLLEGSQDWVNPPANDFFDYFVTNQGTGTLPSTATMNCWEMILYSAYLVGAIGQPWIEQFYTDAIAAPDANVLIWQRLGWTAALPKYPAKTPTGGQLLFYKDGGAYPGHVAISLGGDDAVSLWDEPRGEHATQRIRVDELAGTVYVGDQPW